MKTNCEHENDAPHEDDAPNQSKTNALVDDDRSYINAIQHRQRGPFHIYGVLMVAAYGWDYMVSTANYLAEVDLEKIQVWVKDKNITKDYNRVGNIKDMSSLKQEQANLGIAGVSKTLNLSIRIYWFNQTGILEITTAKNDAVMIAKYAETVIRRTFNTDSAMKKYNDKIEVEECA